MEDDHPVLTDPAETLIRRAFWEKKRRKSFVEDQLTGWRPTAAAFEPSRKNTYLSVNIEASLTAAEKPPTWGIDHERFYAVRVAIRACSDCNLQVKSVPVEGNPHHGGVYGIVELRDTACDDIYQTTLSTLAENSDILPESMEKFRSFF